MGVRAVLVAPVVVFERQGEQQVQIKLGVRRSGRGHQTPLAPSHPLGSGDLKIMRAWMAAEMASPGPRCLGPIQDGQEQVRCGECAACRRYRETIVAAVETAVRQAAAALAGRNALGGDLYYRVPEHLRSCFGLREGEGVKRLLGWYDAQGAFVPGILPEPLTESEAEVYWLTLRHWSGREIQRHLQPPGLRQADPSMWKPTLKTVHNHRWAARRKILAAFGLTPYAALDQDDLDDLAEPEAAWGRA
jgi:hypothetical protein